MTSMETYFAISFLQLLQLQWPDRRQQHISIIKKHNKIMKQSLLCVCSTFRVLRLKWRDNGKKKEIIEGLKNYVQLVFIVSRALHAHKVCFHKVFLLSFFAFKLIIIILIIIIMELFGRKRQKSIFLSVRVLGWCGWFKKHNDAFRCLQKWTFWEATENIKIIRFPSHLLFFYSKKSSIVEEKRQQKRKGEICEDLTD
jgi:hypothetical protein